MLVLPALTDPTTAVEATISPVTTFQRGRLIRRATVTKATVPPSRGLVG